MDSQAQAILDFWFEGALDMPLQTKKFTQRWFGASEETDQEIITRFGDTLTAIAHQEHEDWLQHPRSALAYIIVLDQFSRTIHRGSGQAFAYDAQAREAATQLMRHDGHLALAPIQRVFVYLPFEHSEDLADQKQAVSLFKTLVTAAPHEQKELFENYYDYAIRHAAVIERFRRFPHRNERLKRETTPEEAAFLQEPGSSFG
jgi:uncharacterized protein (DUF924 family)